MPRRNVPPDERIAEWVQQIDGITEEVYTLHLYRALWRELAEITRAAELPPSAFFDALNTWYPAIQGVAVRRQLDRSAGTRSLVRLLQSIERHRGMMTRDRHVALWVGHNPAPGIDIGDGRTWNPFLDEGHANFDRFSGARDRDTISAEVIRADINRLQASGATVTVYANDAIAHSALSPRDIRPTYEDLNDAIDTVAELVNKYTSFLKASTNATFVPAIQQDWTAIFRQAWLPPR